MTQDQREIQRKLRILRYAEGIGQVGEPLSMGKQNGPYAPLCDAPEEYVMLE